MFRDIHAVASVLLVKVHKRTRGELSSIYLNRFTNTLTNKRHTGVVVAAAAS